MHAITTHVHSALTVKFELIIENCKLYWQMVARVRDQVGGWGGRRKIYPRPCQVKSCQVTTPLSPTCAAALQKILTKQSKHMYMYLLTKLSASQTATWLVYFKIHHICKSITHTIFKERHVGPLLKSGKSRQHVARRTPHA
jgi:hypothetical protein